MNDAAPRPFPPMAYFEIPARAARTFDVLWGADGTPYGLIVDGAAYRVKPARRLLVRPGTHWQHIYQVHERSPEGSQEG